MRNTFVKKNINEKKIIEIKEVKPKVAEEINWY